MSEASRDVGADGPRVAIAMRSHNDVGVIRGTLEMVACQGYRNLRLWNFDSSSDDGTLDVIREYNEPERIRQNIPNWYSPGRLLNEAVTIIGDSADIIVFLSSNATPERQDWLERLIAPLSAPDVGAVFGRRSAPSGCPKLLRRDTERLLHDRRQAESWIQVFSTANGAARRGLLEAHPFETAVQCSEAIEWSHRLRRAGLGIVYVPEAAVTHFQEYTLKQFYQRQFGEGKVEAWILPNGQLKTSFLRCMVLPTGMEVLQDVAWALRERSLAAALHSVPLRVTQKWGRWRGLRQGLRELKGRHGQG
jgi:cellulose synthase/poly-beta-1,6-N-acetylglucosamine synthase-like glycosyltransferase